MHFANLDSREYIAEQGIGDKHKSYEHMGRLDSYLDELYTIGRIAGFQYRLLQNEEDIDDEYLENETVKRISKGVFPCVWLNITYDTTVLDEAALADIERELSLAPL